MNANALFELLLPHFQAEVNEFKAAYKHAHLRSFIIPYDRVIELVPMFMPPTGCYCCPAAAQWLRVSRSMIRPYCEKHHPKPNIDPALAGRGDIKP